MGNSTKTKGGKGAPVPISMHPTKGGGHPTGGMAGNVGKGGGKGAAVAAARASELPIA